MLKYPITDEQWKIIGYLFPQGVARPYGKRPCNARSVIDGILWIADNSQPWTHLPATLGSYKTIYIKWSQWDRSGLIDRAIAALESHSDAHCALRLKLRRIESQRVASACHDRDIVV